MAGVSQAKEDETERAMMTARARDLTDRLPAVRGRYTPDAALAPAMWFRVGGTAEVVFEPADVDDLASFLAARPSDVPVTVIGVGSNLLVRDGGIPGVVVRLRQAFRGIDIAWHGERAEVLAGAGALDISVARACRDGGVAGLEFLSGVPGTIGGAVRMNAGAFEREMADVTIDATALDLAGHMHTLTAKELGFTYRHCLAPEDWIFVSARLAGRKGDVAAIAARMDEIARQREESQPIRTRTGGSTFMNPEGDKAWRLIDEAGCRGLRRGAAMVSEQHCNFLINTGGAKAADLEGLGEEVRRRVKERTGVLLQWEIQRVGRHNGSPQTAS